MLLRTQNYSKILLRSTQIAHKGLGTLDFTGIVVLKALIKRELFQKPRFLSGLFLLCRIGDGDIMEMTKFFIL